VTILLAQAPPADAAPRYAQIALHVTECSADTWDVFGDCHESRVEGLIFYIAVKVKVTDAGDIAPGAGRRPVRADVHDIQAYDPGDGAPAAYVYCTDRVTGGVFFDRYTFSGIRITTTAGQPVGCDGYLLLY
jgi:hypothetical protein